MAAVLEEQLGLKAELEVGNRGEFTVWVDGAKVAEKDWEGFPTEQQCLEAVRGAI